MLEDKIIVQDRGFAAGLAALMQNANKGNMDPAALMAMMNNNGMGGNGCWWIWIILLFFVWGGWGGNGFGNRCGEASQLASQLNTDANTNLLMQAINGNKEAISTLSNTLNCDINSVQSALNTINYKGTVMNVSKVYDEPLPPQQFPLPNQNRKKLVDITIGCDGEQKKLSVEENKSIVTDGAVGLTIATDKQQIITMVKNNYNEYKAKKEALAKYEEEMNKCDAILKQLDYQEENLKQEDPRIKELQEQVAELKGLIKQAGNMVPPQMKQMLPQNMQKAMNEAS